MKETVNFWFVVDVSGSMYGQKIATVNAALAECLSELKQIGYSEKCDIKVGIITFAEKMKIQKMNERLESVGTPQIKVEPQDDGLYPITSFACLYKGLKYIFEAKEVSDGKNGKNTFVLLFTDAKPVDKKKYDAVYETIQNCSGFKNAMKYVAYVEDESDRFNKETVKFVDYKAERIVQVSEMSAEIGKLRMTFFSDLANQGDNAKYDKIFV